MMSTLGTTTFLHHPSLPPHPRRAIASSRSWMRPRMSWTARFQVCCLMLPLRHERQVFCITDAPEAPLCRRDLANDIATSLWGLVTPKNFGRVMPGVYRCGFPKPENFSFLKTLGLKSILSVRP